MSRDDAMEPAAAPGPETGALVTPVPLATPRRAAKDVLAQLAGRVAMLALGIITTAVLVRALGPTAYGEWTTLFALSFIAEQMASFGMQQVVVREAAADGRVREWVGALLALKLLTTVAIGVVYIGIVLLLADTDRMRSAGLVIGSTMIFSAGSVMSVVFQLKVRNHVVTLIQMVNTLVWGGSVLALAATDTSMVWFAVAFCATAGLTSTIQVVAGVRALEAPPVLGTSLWPALLRIGIPVGLSGLLILAYARIDQVLVYELAGSEEAGLYGAAYRILDQAHFLPIAVLTTLAPLFAAAHATDPERLRRLLGFAAELLAVVSLAGLALAIAIGEPVLVTIFGEQFRESADVLPVLAAAFVVMCFGYLNGQLVLLYRLQNRFLVAALGALILNLALNFLLVPAYGFRAAAWVVLVTELFVNGITLWIATRAAGGLPPLARLGRIVATAVATTALVWGLDRAGVPWPVAGAAGLAAYAGLLLLSGGLDRAQLRGFIRREA